MRWRRPSWPAATGCAPPAAGSELALVGSRRGAARGARGRRCAGRRPAGARRAGGDLGRSPARRLARGAGRPRARREAPATLERLLAPLAADAPLITVLDGHPATLAWLGSACRPPGLPARRRPLRPVGRHPGPLPRVSDRRRGDHRPRRARLPGPAAAPMTRPPDAVLSIQSAVAYGHVGNSAADAAAAAPRLRRLPGQHRAARASSGPRPGLARPQGDAGADRRDPDRPRGARRALPRCAAVLSGYLGDRGGRRMRPARGRAHQGRAARCALSLRSGDRRRPQRRLRRRRHPRGDPRPPAAGGRHRDPEPLRARPPQRAPGRQPGRRARRGGRGARARPAPGGRHRADAAGPARAKWRCSPTARGETWLVTTPAPAGRPRTAPATPSARCSSATTSRPATSASPWSGRSRRSSRWSKRTHASGADELQLVAAQDELVAPDRHFPAVRLR